MIHYNMQAVNDYLKALQQSLISSFAQVADETFIVDEWQSDLGHGQTAIIDDGQIFERAGINFSQISASALPEAASVRHPHLVGMPYQASGVSLVIHPRNPYCPTVHINVRYFFTEKQWWFGGGMDLTPYYGFVEDCQHFHRCCATALNAIDKTLYARFKANCDNYFHIRHRQEARGVGGLFFDDFNEHSFSHSFSVMQAVGDIFTQAYLPIFHKRQSMPYGERQQQWQHHRRGRYVEFNLVYDRGTLFGLQSGGRSDAILMSLPPSVSWSSARHWGAEEQKLLSDFLPIREWL